MYRSRPKGQLEPDALQFLSSIKDDAELFIYDLLGSEAHSIMLYESGILERDALRLVLGALEKVKANPSLLLSVPPSQQESLLVSDENKKDDKVNKIKKEMDKDQINDSNLFSSGYYEDIHELIEAFVIREAGIDAGGRMHTARSRNDQVVLDIKMKVRDDINNICESIIDLISSLVDKADRNIETIMPMYTHTQQAQIGTFSHFLLSYADALFRDMDRLYVSYGRINQSPLGACAIGGTSIKIDRRKTAILLGFDDIVKNSIDATSSRDSFLEIASNLSILMMTLSKMAEDFVLWSTTEFGYIELSDQYSSSSSAMPQKKNPDPLEVLRAKASLILGSLVSMMATVKALPSGYSRDLQELKPVLWKILSTSLESIKIMNGIIKTLIVHSEKMSKAANSSYAISIDIAEQLVVQKKIPFRTAHRIVGSLVERCANRDIPLSQIDSKEIDDVLRNSGLDLKSNEIQKIILEVNPARSLQLRISQGSPNPLEQKEMISFSNRKLAGYRVGVSRRKGYVEGALNNLLKQVKQYS